MEVETREACFGKSKSGEGGMLERERDLNTISRFSLRRGEVVEADAVK